MVIHPEKVASYNDSSGDASEAATVNSEDTPPAVARSSATIATDYR